MAKSWKKSKLAQVGLELVIYGFEVRRANQYTTRNNTVCKNFIYKWADSAHTLGLPYLVFNVTF